MTCRLSAFARTEDQLSSSHQETDPFKEMWVSSTAVSPEGIMAGTCLFLRTCSVGFSRCWNEKCVSIQRFLE
jgi:hypothetical protein